MNNADPADPAAAVTAAAHAVAHANQQLRLAIRAADKAGVSRNEIARRAKDVMSRPVVLAELGAATIHERAKDVMRKVNIDSFDYELAIGTGSKRPVLLTMYNLPDGFSGLKRANGLASAFQQAGLGLADPDNGWTADAINILAARKTVEVYEL